MNKGQLYFCILNSVFYGIHVTMQTAFQTNGLFFLQTLIRQVNRIDGGEAVKQSCAVKQSIANANPQITQNWGIDEKAEWRTLLPVLASAPSISSYPIPVTPLTCSFFPLSSSAVYQHPIPSSRIP